MLGLVRLPGRTSATKDVELLGSHVAVGLIDLPAWRRSRPVTSATRPGRGSPRRTAVRGTRPRWRPSCAAGAPRPSCPDRTGCAATRGMSAPSPGRPDPRWSWSATARRGARGALRHRCIGGRAARGPADAPLLVGLLREEEIATRGVARGHSDLTGVRHDRCRGRRAGRRHRTGHSTSSDTLDLQQRSTSSSPSRAGGAGAGASCQAIITVVATRRWLVRR
jgi:hypothetical protein